MTGSDEPRNEGDGGGADAAPAGGEESAEESETGRFDKYFEYVLDLLSFL